MHMRYASHAEIFWVLKTGEISSLALEYINIQGTRSATDSARRYDKNV